MAVPTKYQMAKDPSKSCGTCAYFNKVNSSCKKFITYVDKGATCEAWSMGSIKSAQGPMPTPAPTAPITQPPAPPVAAQVVPTSPELEKATVPKSTEEARLDAQNVKPKTTLPKVEVPKAPTFPKAPPMPTSMPKMGSMLDAIRAEMDKAAEATDDEADYNPEKQEPEPPRESAPIAEPAVKEDKPSQDEQVTAAIKAAEEIKAELTAKLEASTKEAEAVHDDIVAKAELLVKAAEDEKAELLEKIARAAEEMERTREHADSQVESASKSAEAVRLNAERKISEANRVAELARAELAAVKTAAMKGDAYNTQAAMVFNDISTKLSGLTDVIKAASEVRPSTEPAEFTKIAEHLVNLAEAVKSASAVRPIINVEPAKVVMDQRPTNWVFTVGKHSPGEEYQVKAEAVKTL